MEMDLEIAAREYWKCSKVRNSQECLNAWKWAYEKHGRMVGDKPILKFFYFKIVKVIIAQFYTNFI